MSVVRPNQIGGNTTVNEITVRTGADIDGDTLVVNDTTDKVGIGLADPKTKLTVDGTVTLKEQAAADSDTAAYGQVWVKTATPCELYFTTDAGDDIQLTTGTGIPATGDITSVVAGTGLSGGGTSGDVTLNVEASQTGITALGTIATGVWEGTAVASAFLDADTAHLSGTQTFTGAKTFTANVTLPNNVYVGKSLYHADDTQTRLHFFNTNDTIALEVATFDFLRCVEDGTSSESVFNFSGHANIDFRVCGDTESHLFYVDAGNERVSIGDSVDAPAATLEVTNNASAGAFDVPLLQLNSNDVDQKAIDINAANTTADVIDLTANSLTTGSFMKLVSDSSSTGDRTLIDITNDNTAAVNTILMSMKNDAIAAKSSVIIESTAAETNPLVQLINSHNSADKPPMLRFNKVGHVSDDMQIGKLSFYGEDDAGPPNPKEYASIVALASDVTSSGNAQSGEMRFNALVNNVEMECIRLGKEDSAGGVPAYALQINAGQNDLDFIVSGDNVGNLIRIIASNDIVGVGGVPTETTAVLSVISTTQGFLPPRMTTTQQNAISSPATGLMLYNTTTNKLMVYNGSAWTALH